MNCKNCNNTLKDTQKYCDECGAKVIQNRLTPKVLATQVNEQFISIDNKFLLTFIHLFKKPEAVINGYIDGTRKKYIDVLQYFAIALTIAGVQFFLMKTFYIEQFENPFQFADPNMADDEFMKNYQNTLNEMMSNGNNYQSLIYILIVPFSAIGTWVAYYYTGLKRLNFTEHIVINLYYTAQTIVAMSLFTLLSTMIGLNFLVSSTLITILGFVYQCYAFKKVTEQSTLETFAKIILSYIVIGIQILILMILFVLVILILKTTNVI